MSSDKHFLTIGDLRRETGAPDHRIKYALNSYNIEPVMRVGATRLFGREQLPQIKSALARISGTREALAK